MSERKAKSKITEWRIIGVSGDTVDGRQISAADLEQMAESYDPAVYGARINLEHFNFLFPGYGGGYGDVVELKAEPWKQDPGKTALLARLSVLPNLQTLWDGGEKIYTSMEILSDFANTGRPYLVGLAITDTPASLGTTANYSAALTAAAATGHKFSTYRMTDTNETEAMTDKTAAAADAAEEKAADAVADGLFARLLAKFAKHEEENKPAAAPAPAEASAAEAKPDGWDGFAADLKSVAALMEKIAEDSAAKEQEIQALSAELKELREAFNAAVFSGNRAPHTGAEDKPAVGW